VPIDSVYLNLQAKNIGSVAVILYIKIDVFMRLMQSQRRGRSPSPGQLPRCYSQLSNWMTLPISRWWEIDRVVYDPCPPSGIRPGVYARYGMLSNVFLCQPRSRGSCSASNSWSVGPSAIRISCHFLPHQESGQFLHWKSTWQFATLFATWNRCTYWVKKKERAEDPPPTVEKSRN
jgi:hypothetical protein